MKISVEESRIWPGSPRDSMATSDSSPPHITWEKAQSAAEDFRIHALMFSAMSHVLPVGTDQGVCSLLRPLCRLQQTVEVIRNESMVSVRVAVCRATESARPAGHR